MTLNDEDRAEITALMIAIYGGNTDGKWGSIETVYLAGLAAGRLRGLEEAAKACAMIKTTASTDAADRHWIAGVAYCVDAIRALAASGTGAKG